MEPILTATFEDGAHVQHAVDALIEHHCTTDAIGVLTPTEDGTKRSRIRMHSGMRTGGLIGMAIGALGGAASAVLVVNGLVPPPGLDIFMTVPPQVAALQGFIIGGAAGGLAGLLIGLGWWTEEVEDPNPLPHPRRTGPTVLGVEASGERVEELRGVLEEAGALTVRLRDPGDAPRMWRAIHAA